MKLEITYPPNENSTREIISGQWDAEGRPPHTPTGHWDNNSAGPLSPMRFSSIRRNGPRPFADAEYQLAASGNNDDLPSQRLDVLVQNPSRKLVASKSEPDLLDLKVLTLDIKAMKVSRIFICKPSVIF